MAIHDGAASTRRTVGVRTGGRSERVVRAVLKATIDELARVGYGPMRVEDVALRAGVNKTTVYRRWPTKSDLVGAAVHVLLGLDEPLPDTGSVRGDLFELVRTAVGFLRTPDGRAIARLATTSAGDPEVERLSRQLRALTQSRRAKVIERGKQRGEIPAGVDAMLVLEAIFAPVMSRVLRFGETMDDEMITRLVDLVVTGAENGGGQGRPRS